MPTCRNAFLTTALLALVVSSPVYAQASSGDPKAQTSAPIAPSAAPPEPSTPPPMDREERKKVADRQLQQQEHQRILGFIPEFNTTNISNAEPLSAKQKFALAFKSGTDPFQFAFAALDAGISQADDGYAGYHQGAAGYFKRFGASYLDSFNGAILGNAALPVLFHEDPRYFRKITGSFKGRFFYSVLSTVRARSDRGGWVPNYGNILGNLVAGGVSNLYYPSSDRGVDLTFERAATVSAEGAIGAFLYEFWPDIQRRFRRHKQQP